MRTLSTFLFTFLVAVSLCIVPAQGEALDSAFSLPVDFSPGPKPSQANYVSETEYSDPSLQVTIEKGRLDDCDYWVARIRIADASQMRTSAAGGFENEVAINGVYLAKRQNAVLAINGDYYAYHPKGLIIRQGVLYRDALDATRDVLAIDECGDFHLFQLPEAGSIGESIDGKKLINVFHFGPALVIDGELAQYTAGEWMVPDLRRQRMCIAQTGPLEYMAVCCAAPARGSFGMTLDQFAQLVHSLGAVQAYNLDGGDSTVMVFNNTKINDIENKNTRHLSDILYFASAWSGD